MTRMLKLMVLVAVPMLMASSGGGCSGAPSDPSVSVDTSALQQSEVKNCALGNSAGSFKHVVYVIFDNTHLNRDNPNVPSDLEQMPHLKDFLTSNGALLSNHHTPLISHTATDILTAFTGVYGDRHGVPIANSFRYFNPDGTSNPGVSFAYWTDPIYDYSSATPTDTEFNMLTASGQNAPAPWVAYTRAGCNVGAVASANIVLENIATDIPVVFGPGLGPGGRSGQQRCAGHRRLRGRRDSLRAKDDKLCATGEWGSPRPPAGRAGRVHGLPGALWPQVCRSAALVQPTQRPRRECDRRQLRQRRFPRLRRHGRDGVAFLRRLDARERGAGGLRLHLRRA